MEQDKKISLLIFKELIKRGYSKEGDSKVWNVADSKLWYLLPEQSQGYLDLCNSEEYKDRTHQDIVEQMIESNIESIVREIGSENINLVDLGCGDGKKAAKIIKSLKSRGIKMRYCPVDISSHMVESAIKTISNLDMAEIIEFRYNISDFENLVNITPLLRKNGYKKNVLLLLGNTLGNFEVNELLYEVRSSMNEDDIFIVDISLNEGDQEERARLFAKNKFANKWLTYIPLQLGLSPEDVKFGARFKNGRAEVYHEILKGKKITFQDKEVEFKKGDKIITLIVYKHLRENLIHYLNMNFSKVETHFSDDKSKVLAICKK